MTIAATPPLYQSQSALQHPIADALDIPDVEAVLSGLQAEMDALETLQLGVPRGSDAWIHAEKRIEAIGADGGIMDRLRDEAGLPRH